MKKTHAPKKSKKIRGTAYELLSMMAMISCMAIERHFTPHAKMRSTMLDMYGVENYCKSLQKAFAHNKDLSVLAKNFGAFVRVAKRVAGGMA